MNKPKQTMAQFFDRADIRALVAIQKANHPSSKAHEDATREIMEKADEIGAGEFFR